MNGLQLVPDQHRRSASRAAGLLDAPVGYDADLPELLVGPIPHSLREHTARYGAVTSEVAGGTGRLVAVLDAVDLAGRGGGHFSAAAKWRAALAAGGGGTVVGNGAESEPASAKDAALLQHRPHLVLDGLACAAAAIGAQRAVIWLHEGSRASQRAVRLAVAERRSAGLDLGGPAFELATGPDAYLSGEAGAVVRALSGGPALPSFRRVPAATHGIGGLPTLVHNVETLARVALAARTGIADYRDTTLVTVVAYGRRTVLEVAPRTTVAEATAHAATVARATLPDPDGEDGDGVDGGAPQAVLLGGYGGTWLPWRDAAGVALDHRALRAAGAGLGAGVVAPLPEGACAVAETARVVDYLAASSARQCGPCVFGLRAVADLLLGLADGQGGKGQLRRLHRYAGEIEGRGACHHPDGAVRLVWSALATFADDFDAHARGRCLSHPGRSHSSRAAGVLPVPGGRGDR